MTEHSLVNTTFPVFLPNMPELRLGKEEFRAKVQSLVGKHPQTSLPVRSAGFGSAVREEKQETTLSPVPNMEGDKLDAPFMEGLLADNATIPTLDSRDGKMLTENADVAYRDSGEALVDLFHELEAVISAQRLKEVLEKAWKDDADATLKIIWNARSIHLGKSSRQTFYRALGWLAETHPLTLISNLQWLVRPLIQKKVPKTAAKKDGEDIEISELINAQDADSDFEMIDEEDEQSEDQPARKKVKLEGDAELTEFDVKYGVAHGYWKDLVNILALAANDELKVDGEPRRVLNVPKQEKKKAERDWTEGRKKQVNHERHFRVVKKLAFNGFYKALHLTVARLFADQLRLDLACLQSGKKANTKHISLAAKWAPTHKGMHDQHTFITSTIAELLHPFETVCPDGTDPADRDSYLKRARIAYQSQTLSPLRKHIGIVERYITEKMIGEIKYDRVPSLAMQRYTTLFAEKDYIRFDAYLEEVASGKAQISGATLFPSTLVKSIFGGNRPQVEKNTKSRIENKIKAIQFRAIDGQWNTLVQRIKDSGTLSDSIAVCDVSGSMTGPTFADGTDPMCASIGLSLLIAEVTKLPFGGAFITFSTTPKVVRVGGPDDKRSFKEKVEFIRYAEWGGNTNFVAVFDLVLNVAIKNGMKQRDMVKQIFLFSDMHFDAAQGGRYDTWSSSYERIQRKFRKAGYEMPKLIFWNLAGGRAGFTGAGDETAPKPVGAAEEGTALVSGYSQGQMKMFLENGTFEEAEEEVVEEEALGEEGELVEVKKVANKMNPLIMVKKAIGHEAYRMLKVVD